MAILRAGVALLPVQRLAILAGSALVDAGSGGNERANRGEVAVLFAVVAFPVGADDIFVLVREDLRVEPAARCTV